MDLLEDHLDEPSCRNGLGAGDVPDLSEGLVPLRKRHQARCEIVDERVRV